MASTHKSLRSSTASKRPTTAIADGQIALNTNAASPGLFFKDSTGATIIKVGPVHVGATAPNATPAAGGSTGNSTGEIWLDNSTTPVGVKIWNGSAWVNATPTGSTSVQGLLELATNAETQTGTDAARAVTPASLQSKVSDSTSTTSSTTIASSTAVKAAYDLANAALPKSGGTVTGAVTISETGSLAFEGATANEFETTLGAVDPTADRTVLLPNVNGTLITTGDTGTVTSAMIADGTIVNADISASAEIAVSKLADGAARQVLQTDAAGTGVEWTSDIALPGTASATSFSPTGSSVPANGFYLPTTNTVALSTNGTGRLFVNANGQISITGAATNATNLTVNGKTFSSTTANWNFPNLGLIRNQSNVSSAKLISFLLDGDTEESTVLTNNLNIWGTYTSPPTTGSTSTGLGASMNLGAPNNFAVHTNASERLRITSTGQLSHIGGGSSGSPAVGFNGSAPSNSLVIDSTGKVGIGTSSPVAGSLLDVRGGAVACDKSLWNRISSAEPTATRGLLFTTDGTDYGRIYSPNGKSVAIQAGNGTLTDALTVDQSGNVGIGTTSPLEPLHIENLSADLMLRSTSDTGNSRIFFGDLSATNAGLISYAHSDNSLSFNVNGGERARIDSSGRLLVGTSTSIAHAGANNFQIQTHNTSSSSGLSATRWAANAASTSVVIGKSRGANVGTRGIVSANDSLGAVDFQGDDGTAFIRAAQIAAEVDGTPGANDMPGRLVFATTADGASSPTERMRITSTGRTATFTTNDTSLSISNSAAAGLTYPFIFGRHSATAVNTGTASFAVYTNGDVQNTNNAYGALSDIKLKENIVDANSQWDDIKALQVRNYNLKEGQTHTQIGLVAQEVELVSPGLVSESPDLDEDGNDLGTVTKSVNYSVLYMKAVKALQEAIGRIEALEAEVAALKG